MSIANEFVDAIRRAGEVIAAAEREAAAILERARATVERPVLNRKPNLYAEVSLPESEGGDVGPQVQIVLPRSNCLPAADALALGAWLLATFGEPASRRRCVGCGAEFTRVRRQVFCNLKCSQKTQNARKKARKGRERAVS